MCNIRGGRKVSRCCFTPTNGELQKKKKKAGSASIHLINTLKIDSPRSLQLPATSAHRPDNERENEAMKSAGKCEEQQRVSVHWSQEKKSKSIRAKLSFTCIVLVFATLNTRTMQVLASVTYLASFLHVRPPDETKTQLFDNLCTSRSKKRKKKNPMCLKSAKVLLQHELAWVKPSTPRQIASDICISHRPLSPWRQSKQTSPGVWMWYG